MKREISSLSRLNGIVTGVLLTFIMAVFAITQVITNEDFWLKQNDRYHHQETLSLVSSDDYSTLYRGYISMFKGKETDFTVTKKGNPDDFSDTFKKLGSIHLSQTDIHFENSISLDEKFMGTLKALENIKYSAVDFNNKTYIEFSCPLANTEFLGVNIKNLKITDNKGNEVDFSLKSVSVLKDGSIKIEDVENSENLLFKPQSKTTVLRTYLLTGDIENLTVAFDASAEKGSAGVNIKFSYEDELTSQGVASIIGPEEDILTIEEDNQLLKAGAINNILKIVCWVLFIIVVALIAFTVKKEKRQSLLGIGFYMVVTSLVLVVIVNLLAYYVPSQWGFQLVFEFYENSTSSILMGDGFMRDFALGTARFFTFIMIAPVFVGYILTKISKTKHYDPNEDYLYQ